MKSKVQLEATIRECRTELARRVHADDPFKAIKGQEHCKRALIVAAVQGHTVGIYGPRGTGKTMLRDAAHALGVPTFEFNTCPCGNYTNPRCACECDSEAITAHWQSLRPQVDQCDIHVEAPTVPSSELLSKQHGSTTAWAHKQVDQAGPLPPKDALGPGCDIIIRQVVSELGLSAKALDICLSVAQSVAALAENDTILVDYLMEAVHYRRLDKMYNFG